MDNATRGLTLPYQADMKLGRTYDVQRLQAGIDFLPETVLSDIQTQELNQTSETLCVVKTAKDIANLLNMTPAVALKVKAGILQHGPGGQYLCEYTPEDNRLEVLIRVYHETVHELLKLVDPASYGAANVAGSYLVRGTNYGAELIIRLRIQNGNSSESKELSTLISDDQSRDVSLLLKKIIERFNGRFQIKCFTDLKIRTPKTIDEVVELIGNVEGHLLNQPDRRGFPLVCQLQSLGSETKLIDIETEAPSNESDTSRTSEELLQLEAAYDDVQQARSMLADALKRDDIFLLDKQENRAGELEDSLDELMQVFNDVVIKIDLSAEQDCSALVSPALVQYKTALDEQKTGVKAGSYTREVKRFIKTCEPPSPRQSQVRQRLKDLPRGNDLYLVMIGDTGHGKSATANTILGKDYFRSEMSYTSVTKYCQTQTETVGGRTIHVVDTPGSMANIYSRDPNCDLGTALTFVPEGCTAFLLVINVTGRFTQEKRSSVQALMRSALLKTHVVLVFTYGNDVYEKQRSMGKMDFRDFLASMHRDLAHLADICRDRCVLIDNSEEDPKKRRAQLYELVEVIDSLHQPRYTEAMFQSEKKKVEDERIRKELADAAATEVHHGEERILIGPTGSIYRPIEAYGCFSARGSVLLEAGECVPMEDLQVGDKVLSSVQDGTRLFSEVYFFSHRDGQSVCEFLSISTGSTKLKVTPEHHIYTVEDGVHSTVPAKKICAGDEILVFDVDKHCFNIETVTSVSSSMEMGIYAPITLSGTIVVDNVFSSCYVDLVSPDVSHVLLWPMRQLFRFLPSVSAWVNSPGKRGMPGWVYWCMQNVLQS